MQGADARQICCPGAVRRCRRSNAHSAALLKHHAAADPLPATPRKCGIVHEGFPLPTTSWQCGGERQHINDTLAQGSAVVKCESSTARCPTTMRQHAVRDLPPLAPKRLGRVPRLHRRPLPRAMQHYVARDQLPAAPQQCGGVLPQLRVRPPARQRGNVLQEFHRSLPRGSAAVYSRRSPTHCHQAVWQCVA